MSDGVETEATAPEPVVDSPSAGMLLKSAREAQGLHIAALAVSLKVSVKKIEALESDRLDLLPDAVFVRGLASSVCRTLKIDPTEILARLPQTNKPRLSYDQQSINTPFRMPADGPGPGLLNSLSRPAALAVLALLLGALVLIFLPEMSKKTSETTTAVVSGVPSNASTGAGPATSGSADSPAGGTAMGAGSAVLSTLEGSASVVASALGYNASPTMPLLSTAGASPSVALTAAASVPTLVSPSLAVPSKPVSATPTVASAVSADAIVVFRAKGETWVEVVDATSKVTLRRTLLAGEAAGATGATPLRVTVGRADQTQVLVRGKPFDGDTQVRDNVLRFEVK